MKAACTHAFCASKTKPTKASRTHTIGMNGALLVVGGSCGMLTNTKYSVYYMRRGFSPTSGCPKLHTRIQQQCGSSCEACTDLPQIVFTALEQIANSLRNRWVEVAFAEWTDSFHAGKDKRSKLVWMKYNWWMVPWWDLAEGVH